VIKEGGAVRQVLGSDWGTAEPWVGLEGLGCMPTKEEGRCRTAGPDDARRKKGGSRARFVT
jgi:hypothetical protein